MIVMVGGSVENERVFSTMAFIKNKLRNRLDKNLNACVRAATQVLFDVDSFPYKKTLDAWHAGATARGRYVFHSDRTIR